MPETIIECKGFDLDGGKQSVAKIIVKPIGFKVYVEARKIAGNAATEQEAQKVFLRERMKRQCTFLDASDKPIQASDAVIAAVPVRTAFRLKDAIEATLYQSAEAQPQLLSDGDGISAAIHLKLANPLMAGGDKKIEEIEIIASTLSDIEDVLVADTAMERALALLSLGKPVGDARLVALPSWAIDQFSLADGLFVARAIVPDFTQGQASL